MDEVTKLYWNDFQVSLMLSLNEVILKLQDIDSHIGTRLSDIDDKVKKNADDIKAQGESIDTLEGEVADKVGNPATLLASEVIIDGVPSEISGELEFLPTMRSSVAAHGTNMTAEIPLPEKGHTVFVCGTTDRPSLFVVEVDDSGHKRKLYVTGSTDRPSLFSVGLPTDSLHPVGSTFSKALAKMFACPLVDL